VTLACVPGFLPALAEARRRERHPPAVWRAVSEREHAAFARLHTCHVETLLAHAADVARRRA
jgi:hypothetical protein